MLEILLVICMVLGIFVGSLVFGCWLAGWMLNHWRNSPEVKERLAEIEHKQWSHWTLHFLEFDTPDNRLYWKNLANLPYSKLSPQLKDADRVWADKVLEALTP